MVDLCIQIIVGIVAGVISSFVFWLFSFKRTGVKIHFADKIAEYHYEDEEEPIRYRIKFANIGNHDLLDCRCICHIKISLPTGVNGEYRKNLADLNLGVGGYALVIRGNKSSKKDGKVYAKFHTICMTPDAMEEYARPVYSERIREKAKAGTLKVWDVIQEYKGSFRLMFYIIGTDPMNGRIIVKNSKEYSYDDIELGEYVGVTEGGRGKDFLKKGFRIENYH